MKKAEIFKEFVNACINNDIDKVSTILKYGFETLDDVLVYNKNIILDNGKAYICISPLHQGFSIICKFGYLDLAKIFIDTIKNQNDEGNPLKFYIDIGIKKATKYNKNNIIEFLNTYK
jgi:hypothetical protein